MDGRVFMRMLAKAVRLYDLTEDGEDHGFTAVMDELVEECSDKQWEVVAATFELESPSQAVKVN